MAKILPNLSCFLKASKLFKEYKQITQPPEPHRAAVFLSPIKFVYLKRFYYFRVPVKRQNLIYDFIKFLSG